MHSDSIFARINLQRQHFDLDVDVILPSQGVTAIFGHSGSGKTSLLRCIAGLEKTKQGLITVKGEVWQNETHFLPTHKRSIGYVFQEAALFPHLTADENIHYGIKRASSPLDRELFDHIIDLLGIEALLQRLPQQLSGGEKQRVAIARALLVNPKLLLMDEPLASLDVARKQEILPYLERIKAELALPILYVSHSPNEIARLADHLVALEAGKVVASGPLIETLASLDFPIQLGEDTGVVLDAKVIAIHSDWHLAKVAFSGGELWVRDGGYPVGADVRVRVLARDISLANSHHHDTSIVNLLAGVVDEIKQDTHPAMALIRIKVNGSALVARITRRSVDNLNVVEGSSVWAQIKSAALVR